MVGLVYFLLAIAGSYLLGSLCSAVIVSKYFKLPDPRSEGSQNPGATNVLRLSGKKYAAFVLLADMLKGFLPVVIVKLCGAGATFQGYVCLAAVLGHLFPVFFKFKGGKGVATALGAMLGLHVLLGLVLCALWIVVAAISRYSSLASLVVISLTPIVVNFFPSTIHAFYPVLIMTFCVLIKHKDNFERLKRGEESKLNFKKQ